MVQTQTPVLFIDEGNPIVLSRSLDTFYTLNSAGLPTLDINLCTYRPSAITRQAILPFENRLTLFVESKDACLPCVMDKVKINPKLRYIVLIPASFISLLPIYPYIPEIESILARNPDIAQVQFFQDQSQRNAHTKAPVIYQYITKNILVGNGNFTNGPSVIRAYRKHRPPAKFRTAYLKPTVFAREVY